MLTIPWLVTVTLLAMETDPEPLNTNGLVPLIVCELLKLVVPEPPFSKVPLFEIPPLNVNEELFVVSKDPVALIMN